MSKLVREAIKKALGRGWKTTDEILPGVREALGDPIFPRRILSDAMWQLLKTGEVESQSLVRTRENGAPKKYRRKP